MLCFVFAFSLLLFLLCSFGWNGGFRAFGFVQNYKDFGCGFKFEARGLVCKISDFGVSELRHQKPLVCRTAVYFVQIAMGFGLYIQSLKEMGKLLLAREPKSLVKDDVSFGYMDSEIHLKHHVAVTSLEVINNSPGSHALELPRTTASCQPCSHPFCSPRACSLLRGASKNLVDKAHR